ncbi:DUF1573 domain-containing protein [Hyunsoonleella sp. SJ7]|uniref:DUF1573 domain-containing protein n=1 Tax=Hyunsoonleella aquatilis TaxID=2762758 RepID=A0A923KG98_9FLAO|nr:DUF1573 domain-containing protein [Hyunsoonleella aquatilis]MBC3757866.1 DUF1573 domain-containing protein [Hyunsoonleella aquatilis]
MKRTVNILVMLLFIGATTLTQAQELAMLEEVAIIDFETEVMDYGTIEQGSDGTRIFKFTNKGNAPLIISEVKTSCGCTVPSYSKAPILPGEQGELKVKYNTKKLGNFTKTITVISNAKEVQKILKIKGKVVATN